MLHLIKRRSATEPSGTTWTVGVRWIPRGPKWIGWGFRRKRAKEAKTKGRSKGLLDGMDLLDAIDEPGVIAAIAVIALIVVLGWFIVVPLTILVLDIIFVLLVAALGVAFRVLFRRPWTVEATSPEGRLEWPVVGFLASRRAVDQVVQALELGQTPTP